MQGGPGAVRSNRPRRNVVVDHAVDYDIGNEARVRVMDEDEFHAHQVKYNYPPQVVATAQATCDYLATHIKTAEPFTTAYKPYLSQIRSLTEV